MAHFRGAESPMEFEYDNKFGRLGTSPFADAAYRQNAGTMNHNFASPQPTSPRKPMFQRPDNLPQTPKPAPFRENINTDFSSPGESSPETGGHGADTEDTPDMKGMDKVAMFRGSSPRKKKWSFSQSMRAKATSTALTKRDTSSNKRKRLEVEKEDERISFLRPDDTDNSRPSSSEGPPGSQSKTSFRKKARDVGTLPAILTFIHEHPQLPTILAFYGQMLFSLFILLMMGWGIWNVWGAISQQIEIEAEKLGMDVLLEIRQCEKSWFANRCDDTKYVAPALERMCEEWDHCRNQDWKAQGRAKIGAHTFASILNNFVEPLSYKFIICALAVVALLVLSPHQLFGSVRRANEAHIQQQQQQQQGPSANGFVPQTPSRQISNEWAMNNGFFTPQTQGRHWDSGREWGSPSKRLEARSQSPVKQLEYKAYS